MSRKQEILSAISSAVYGEEVRGAIHDGIEECYDNVENKIVASSTAPTSPNAQIWIDTSETTTDSMPQIDDAHTSSSDTWSSQKITNEIGQLSDDISNRIPYPESPASKYGTNGQLLRTIGNGKTEWVDIGLPTDEQTGEAVSNWLDAHPEATTTVQDGSITVDKFSDDLKLHTLNNYVTPEMFGATADGSTDDLAAINLALSASANTGAICLLNGKAYYVSDTIVVPNGSSLIGSGPNITVIQSSIVDKPIIKLPNNTKGILRGFRVLGIGSHQCKGICIGDAGSNNVISARDLSIKEVEVQYCYNAGIYFESVFWQMLIDNCSIVGTYNGVGLDVRTNDCFFSNIIISQCYIGMKCSGSANKYVNFKIDWCRPLTYDDVDFPLSSCYGLYLNNETRGNFVNIEVQQCIENGVYFGSNNCIFYGFTIDGIGNKQLYDSGDARGIAAVVPIGFYNNHIELKITNPGSSQSPYNWMYQDIKCANNIGVSGNTGYINTQKGKIYGEYYNLINLVYPATIYTDDMLQNQLASNDLTLLKSITDNFANIGVSTNTDAIEVNIPADQTYGGLLIGGNTIGTYVDMSAFSATDEIAYCAIADVKVTIDGVVNNSISKVGFNCRDSSNTYAGGIIFANELAQKLDIPLYNGWVRRYFVNNKVKNSDISNVSTIYPRLFIQKQNLNESVNIQAKNVRIYAFPRHLTVESLVKSDCVNGK